MTIQYDSMNIEPENTSIQHLLQDLHLKMRLEAPATLFIGPSSRQEVAGATLDDGFDVFEEQVTICRIVARRDLSRMPLPFLRLLEIMSSTFRNMQEISIDGFEHVSFGLDSVLMALAPRLCQMTHIHLDMRLTTGNMVLTKRLLQDASNMISLSLPGLDRPARVNQIIEALPAQIATLQLGIRFFSEAPLIRDECLQILLQKENLKNLALRNVGLNDSQLFLIAHHVAAGVQLENLDLKGNWQLTPLGASEVIRTMANNYTLLNVELVGSGAFGSMQSVICPRLALAQEQIAIFAKLNRVGRGKIRNLNHRIRLMELAGDDVQALYTLVRQGPEVCSIGPQI